MALSIGIVGLPNVGKSTLFNALTDSDILAANYPFATIEPNTGIVPVPDPRLNVLADMYKSQKIIPATVTFVDIAGLVAGASRAKAWAINSWPTSANVTPLCTLCVPLKTATLFGMITARLTPKKTLKSLILS